MTQSVSTSALDYSAAADGAEEPGWLGLPKSAWKKAAIIAVTFVALFWTNLWRLWLKTNPFFGEANWGHAVCVPVIGLYYLYIHRDELLRAGVLANMPCKPSKVRLVTTLGMIFGGLAASLIGPHVSHGTLGDAAAVGGQFLAIWGALILFLNAGLGTAIFGILFFAYGIYPGQNDYVKDLGMVITLFGVVLTMCGWKIMRIAWFPIAFLVCALPWPGLVYSMVASPLQNLAASVAVGVLRVCQIDAFHTGTKIIFMNHGLQRTLNVAEACAGLRSLMTFISVAAAVAFLSARPLWQKLFITAMAVPIAVLCNVMRVSGQGIIDYNLGAEWSENFAHQMVGLFMLIPAFFFILLVGWILDKIFIEEADEDEIAAAAAGGNDHPREQAESEADGGCGSPGCGGREDSDGAAER